MEHRNLERKWRPSFALGPHLTEGRSNDERRRICDVVVVARVSGLAASSYRRISDVWVPRGFIARDASNTNRGLRERRFFLVVRPRAEHRTRPERKPARDVLARKRTNEQKKETISLRLSGPD
jgi:hypothetical protein